jgi:hypothetical protein
MAIVLSLSQPAPSHARVGNLNNRQMQQATDDDTPKYQRFPYYWPNCPAGFEITSQEECSKAITALGVTNGGNPWVGSRTTMPKGCNLQKETDSMIFNTNPNGDQRRWDLAPVCKWTGEEAPPDFFRVSKEDVTEWRGVEHTITVKPEEWDYFLAFQESRKNGFSCPCNPDLECNEEKAPGKHFYPPNPEKVTFDCTLWIAAWMHAEDQCIQGYFSHISRDGTSARMRCEEVGAVYGGEHQAGRHTTGLGALRGLQTSPGHCNSMFNPSYFGFAVAHGARRNDPRGDGDVWTVLYNGGGDDIADSESCIPAGYTATGERTQSQPTTPPQSTPSPTIATPEPTKATPEPTKATPEPTAPTPGPASKYQKLDYGVAACPDGLEIVSESECREAIAALGVTNGGNPWVGSRTTMPEGCNLQKDTDSMVFNTGEGGEGRHDLAPVCKLTPPPKYQKLDYGVAACPDGLEIVSESECREAIAALGVTNGGDPWVGSRETMPEGCNLQINTDTMVFNTGEGGQGRHDLAPVCKLTGTS